MENIKNIIFDLGGVLLTLDFAKTEKAFIDLGVKNFSELYSQQKASPLFEQLETGHVSNAEFYKQFSSISKCTLQEPQVETAWCSMLGHFPDEVLTWLEDIKNRYNIYLFSNTNRIHQKAFEKIYEQQTGKTNFEHLFVKAWYSHDLGLRKPHPEAFQRLLEIEQLNPAETLFIDDSKLNIEGAEKVGLQTIWLKPPQSVTELNLWGVDYFTSSNSM